MRKIWGLLQAYFFVLLLFTSQVYAEEGRQVCQRVISTAPSLTEVLYKLGLGDRVVGVSRHCRYPEEVIGKERVGGLFNLDFERIVVLRPDLVVLLEEYGAEEKSLRRLGFNTARMDHRSLTGIMQSIKELAELCGKEERAREIVGSMEARIEGVRKRVANQRTVPVLLGVGRSNAHDVRDVFLSGRDGFYNELLQIAGGVNVFAGSTAAMPAFSFESIIALKPEVIIEIIPRAGELGIVEEDLKAAWKGVLSSFGTPEEVRVFLITDDYSEIPGPRFVELLGRFADVLHGDKR